MPARAQLDAVTLTRDGRPVLHDVALTVPAAGVTAVVGPSGAGKSSLLRCLVRLEEPDGRVCVDGEEVRSLDPCALRRRVGLVAQSPVMLDGTVADNLAYGLDGGLSQDQLCAAAASAGLGEDFLGREAAALSGGESMRVAIARALARDPVLLLLDEPTAALDATTAAALETSLAGLAADGLAILAVTHDEGLARRLATSVVRLVDGRVVATGSPDEVLT